MLVVLVAMLQPMLIGRAHAQRVPHLQFTTFSTEQGLSSLRVWEVLQDRRGFIWIATGDGLNRYDGHRVTNFHAGGAGTLSHDQVWALHEDHEGMLWVGTYGGGLNRFDPATELFTHYRHDPDNPNSLSDDRIRDIHESPHAPGILWVGTYGGGLDRLDTRTGTFSHFRHDPDDAESLPDNIINEIFEDHAGILWVGTFRGLVYMVPAGQTETDGASPHRVSFRRVPLDENSNEERVLEIEEDAEGSLWVGVGGAGLYLIQRDKNEVEGTIRHFDFEQQEADSLGFDNIRKIMVDEAGTLWIGTYGRGISQLDPATGTITNIRHRPGDPQSLSHNIVRELYTDRSGVVWVGTFGGGVSKMRPDKFFVHRHRLDRPDGLLPGRIAALAEGSEGAIWVGNADRGLTQITRVLGQIQYRHFFTDADDELEGLQVMTLLTLKEGPGVLWVGSLNQGLFKVDERSGRVLARYDPPARARPTGVLALHASACEPGKFWVTTSNSLVLFDPATETFEEVLTDVALGVQQRNRHGFQTSVDDPCTLWFSGSQYGLARITAPPARRAPSDTLPPYTIKRYPPPPGLGLSDTSTAAIADQHILLAQTSDSRLWASVLNGRGGLVAFHPETDTFTKYTQQDGLLSDLVFAAQMDDDGRLWVVNGFGLSALDLATGVLHNYDVTDGLTVTGWQRATLKASDGTLYFGGDASLTEVPPGSVPSNDHIPPVALTGFRIDDRVVPINTEGTKEEGFTLRHSITYTDALTLPPDANVLTFEFAALDFTAPQKNQYAYRMEGFDATWREAGTENTATYTNLDPGRYVFRVRGSNNDGVWNEEGTRLTIHVLPPWYQTWWAYALYMLLATSGMVAFVYWRERRLRQRASDLETAVAERTERLRQQQAQLEDQTQALQEANAFQSRFLANISHEFRTPLTLTFGPINDLLDGRYQVEKTALPHLKRAQRNGKRLLRLINQLLELSRLDAGALRLDAHHQDLGLHLREIAVLFQDIAAQRRLRLILDLPEAPLLHVFDADKIEKVVVNLLSNAVKFTPPDGSITLALAKDAGGVCITVADTGRGIAAKHLPHLFDRFYQVEGEATRSHEGSGIGLALVQELVALHQGRITVESMLEEGTTFTVYLPVLEEGEATAMAPTPEQHQGDGSAVPLVDGLPESPLHLEEVNGDAARGEAAISTAPAEEATVVLVVEDNADMRAYIRSHLDPPYTILEAENGRVGVERAMEEVPDLVLSDVMMPEMDGLALTDALKQDVRTSHVPVVLLTAKAEVEYRIAGFESGADAYLPKPFDADELRVRVRTLIEERRRLRTLWGKSEAAQQGAEAWALPAREQAFLAEVEASITEHLGNAMFGVDDLAAGLHLSRRQLLRKLKALTDESPGALLRRMRLERAVGLLREGALAKEVAHTVGFRDYSAFWRAFNKAYGTSPSDYVQDI